MSIPTELVFILFALLGCLVTDKLLSVKNRGKLKVRIKMKDGSAVTRYISAQYLADNYQPYICPTCTEQPRGEGDE